METEQIQAELIRAADLSLSGKLEEAIIVYEELVRHGSAYAEVQLGYIFLVGRGVQRDVKRAEELFRSSAGRGDLLGKYYLGLCYQETNREQLAFSIMSELSKLEYLPALNRLGWMYENGIGCRRDLKAAVRYRKDAASSGHLYAKRWLGYRMAIGKEGVLRIPFGIVSLASSMVQIFWFALKAPSDARVQG